MKSLTVFAMILILSACGGSPSMKLLKKHHNDLVVYEDFGVCKGYGCRYYLKTGLSDGEWQQITDVFTVPPKEAAEEREYIKKAIGLFERLIGPKTGTDSDDAGAQIINFSTRDQMDCIDEAFNSSTYLHLLRKAGLIRFHRLGKPLRRGNFIDRWPHNTATIHELALPETVKGEGHYVVDSWFHANGVAPEIIPASLWSKGWSPDKE
ncbi:hypothetical protein MNBD_ALPHA01-105 [hydrothermal vent metagenome]|uniref:Lipoprotein n=1 Tax=hydrothermal vent metagenome TaxID=652676 RepID=A0A3B0S3Q2_9ZZZZ